MKKIIAALAGGLLAVFAIGAPVYAAPARHAVGSVWSETAPDGTTVSVTQIDAVAQQVTPVKAGKVSLLSANSGAVALTKSSCTWGYICFWNTPGYLGSFWRYDTSAIVNGGSCYNMTVANNNVSESFFNNSLYTGALHNWVNCNSPAGQLPVNGNPAQGVFNSFRDGGYDDACTYYTNGMPCDWATSIAVNP